MSDIAPLAVKPADNAPFYQRIIWLLVDRFTAPQFILSMVSTALFAWLLNQLLQNAIPDNARELVSAALGFLIGQMVGPGYQFYLGNTKSSEDKNQALKANADTLRAAGLQVGSIPPPGQAKPPIDVNLVNPYVDKTEAELTKLLKDRTEDPSGMSRDAMIAKLNELDKNIPLTEPHQ